MKRPIEFRVSAMRRFIGNIEPEVRKYLEGALDQIESGKLQKKIIDESAASMIISWDFYLLGIIGSTIAYYDFHRNNGVDPEIDPLQPTVALRKLKWPQSPSSQEARGLSKKLAKLKGSPVSTAAFLVVGRTSDSNKSLTLFWHHPDLWESDAVKLLRSWAGYSQVAPDSSGE